MYITNTLSAYCRQNGKVGDKGQNGATMSNTWCVPVEVARRHNVEFINTSARQLVKNDVSRSDWPTQIEQILYKLGFHRYVAINVLSPAMALWEIQVTRIAKFISLIGDTWYSRRITFSSLILQGGAENEKILFEQRRKEDTSTYWLYDSLSSLHIVTELDRWVVCFFQVKLIAIGLLALFSFFLKWLFGTRIDWLNQANRSVGSFEHLCANAFVDRYPMDMPAFAGVCSGREMIGNNRSS